MLTTTINILCLVFVVAQAAKLPSYIKPCKRLDPNLNKCAVQHGNDAIPRILKGNRKYKVPPLNPLRLPEVSLKPSPNLKFKLRNLTIDGIQTTVVKDIRINLEKRTMATEVHMDYIVVTGQYEIQGRLLVPLDGSGPANISMHDVTVVYSFDFDTQKKQNEDYMIIEKDNLEFRPQDVHFQLDNLLSNQQLSEETNRVLNENTGQVGNELNSVVSETIKTIVTEIVKNYLTAVPLNEVFV